MFWIGILPEKIQTFLSRAAKSENEIENVQGFTLPNHRTFLLNLWDFQARFINRAIEIMSLLLIHAIFCDNFSTRISNVIVPYTISFWTEEGDRQLHTYKRMDLIFGGLLTPFRSNVVNGDVTEGSQFTQLRKCESPNAADFYDCCKNQRPVLLCTIPMLSLPAWYRSRAVGAGVRQRAMHSPQFWQIS